MLNVNGHTITYIEVGGHEITNVYFGASLVWTMGYDYWHQPDIWKQNDKW